VRYTVTCDGAPVGHVELPPVEAWEHGSAHGTLEPLPAFDPLRVRLEAALRASFLIDDRVFNAQEEGRLPPPSLTLSSESQQITTYDITPEELGVGADVLRAVADVERITFRLLEADGDLLPANTDVYVRLTALPEWPGSVHQPSVTVLVPRTGDEDHEDEPPESEA
jgi:hypothetical protein